MSKYYVGIDLGTTNCAVSYIEKDLKTEKSKNLPLEQIIEFGEVKLFDLLPSFIFMPDLKEIPDNGFSLSWNSDNTFCVGEFAKKNGSKSPYKVIASAKSWLCSENIDRLSPVLPWGRNDSVQKISPVAAAEMILNHIKNCWNHLIAKGNSELTLDKQNVVITVPASFDAVARELTVKAAEKAGINCILLEEPQSAFYSWIDSMGDKWRKTVNVGDKILVCDIGGGTTDFSLIKVSENGGNLELERVAVGNHLLLGGDNMDLTLAYSASMKLQKSKNINLDSYQITGLKYACQTAKENLLGNPKAKPEKLTVLGRGSSLIGGAISVELTRDDIIPILIDGFFPHCSLEDKPLQTVRAGLKTFGLKYENDPAITKHLAVFLSKHCSDGKLPNLLLFNGGVTKSAEIQHRITEVLQNWLPKDVKIKILEGNNPDKAVARGACCYAGVREGKGVRIKAGSSHSYYLGVEASMPAIPGYKPPVQGVCVLPIGTEEGSSLDINYEGLGLIVGESTEFKFFSSNGRKSDKPGFVIENINDNKDLEELPPLSALLPASQSIPPGSLIPVKLHCEFTETGTLQVWCNSEADESKWKLDFELRKEEV